jgi:hypothetical protein
MRFVFSFKSAILGVVIVSLILYLLKITLIPSYKVTWGTIAAMLFVFLGEGLRVKKPIAVFSSIDKNKDKAQQQVVNLLIAGSTAGIIEDIQKYVAVNKLPPWIGYTCYRKWLLFGPYIATLKVY